MNNILTRRQTHFVLWCPAAPVHTPELIIGQIQNGNPPTFQQLTRQAMQQVINAGGAVEGLWALEASTLGLIDGETYHYWFEVDNRSPGQHRSDSNDRSRWLRRWITGCMPPPTPRSCIRPP